MCHLNTNCNFESEDISAAGGKFEAVINIAISEQIYTTIKSP
jgi:predicted nucleic-acid-binding Zn-ribbon protein